MEDRSGKSSAEPLGAPSKSLRSRVSCGLRGLTLTEILVVIAVIGLLAAVALPVVTDARKRASEARCMNNLRQISMALSLYRDDNDGDFTTVPRSLRDLQARYLKSPAMLICNSEPVCQGEEAQHGSRTGLSYFYHGALRGSSSRPDERWDKLVEQRGAEAPIVFDLWHGRPRACAGASTQGPERYLVLRIGGQISLVHRFPGYSPRL